MASGCQPIARRGTTRPGGCRSGVSEGSTVPAAAISASSRYTGLAGGAVRAMGSGKPNAVARGGRNPAQCSVNCAPGKWGPQSGRRGPWLTGAPPPAPAAPTSVGVRKATAGKPGDRGVVTEPSRSHDGGVGSGIEHHSPGELTPAEGAPCARTGPSAAAAAHSFAAHETFESGARTAGIRTGSADGANSPHQLTFPATGTAPTRSGNASAGSGAFAWPMAAAER